MNRDEAKNILLLYRHGTADADDPQIAGALALAQRDPDLARWLEAHCARQFVLREKLRQITAPAGLKEQIIAEHAAEKKVVFRWQKITLLEMAALVLLMAVAAPLWFLHHKPDDTLVIDTRSASGRRRRSGRLLPRQPQPAVPGGTPAGRPRI